MLARMDDLYQGGAGFFAPGGTVGIGMPSFANVRWSEVVTII